MALLKGAIGAKVPKSLMFETCGAHKAQELWKLEKEFGAFPSINSWIQSVWCVPLATLHRSQVAFSFSFYFCGWWLKLVEYIFGTSLASLRLQMFWVHAPTAKSYVNEFWLRFKIWIAKHVVSVRCEFL